MLYEIAALPDIFEYASSSKDREDAMDSLLFSVSENGLLLNLGNGLWLKQIYEMKMPQSLRDLVLAYVNRLLDFHRIINCPLNLLSGQQGEAWLEYARQAHLAKELAAIITCNDDQNEQGHDPLPIIKYPPNRSQLWNANIRGRMTLNVTKNETDFRRVLGLLLSYAKRALIVDPYLNCEWKKYKKFLWLVAELLGNFRDGRSTGFIEIQTSLKAGFPTTKVEMRKMWKATLEPIRAKHNHAFVIKILRNTKRIIEPHNRFIFTDQCGVKTGYGFDCYEDNKAGVDEWTLLDRHAWKQNEARFTIIPEFELFDEFELR